MEGDMGDMISPISSGEIQFINWSNLYQLFPDSCSLLKNSRIYKNDIL